MSEPIPPRRRLQAPAGSNVLPSEALFSDPGMEGQGGAKFKEYLGIIRRHIWLVLGVAVVILAAAGYRAYQKLPLYRSAAVVRLIDERAQMAGGIGLPGADLGAFGYNVNPILSEIQILRSQGLSREVIDREGLRLRVISRDFPAGLLEEVSVAREVPPDSVHLSFAPGSFTARRGQQELESPYGARVELGGVAFSVARRPEAESAQLVVLPLPMAVELFQLNLRVSSRENTNFIDIEYSDHDPLVTQRVVNTVVETFRSTNAAAAQQDSRRRRIFIEEQLATSEQQLAAVQQELSQFRSRELVYSSAAKITAQQEGLMELEARRNEYVANQRAYREVLRTLQAAAPGTSGAMLRTLVSSPEIASNPVVTQMYQLLSEHEARRDSLTSGLRRRSETDWEVERVVGMIAAAETRLIGAVASHLDGNDARIGALTDLIARASTEIQSAPGTESEEVWLMLQAEGIQQMVENLRLEHQRARITEEVEAGKVDVVDLALDPGIPAGTGRLRMLLFALVAGLALGGGAAIVLERMNTSIRRREDIEQLLRIPGLAVIPRIVPRDSRSMMRIPEALRIGGGGRQAGGRPGGGNGNGNGGGKGRGVVVPHQDDRLIASFNSRSIGAEAYRTLRTNLIFSQAVQTLRTIVVTSASPAEGKSTTAANLAVTFAQQKMRVALVDCDLRRGRIHEAFGVPREPGLTQAVLGMRTVAEVIRPTGIEGLSIITGGTLPPNPSELLAGEKMRGILEELESMFDIILIDSPPLLAAADAAVLGTIADGVLLVLRAGSTDQGAAQQAMRQLNAVGANVVGAVLNDTDAKVSRYAAYDYPQEYYGASEKV